jgi:aminoglycoside 3-N-acetyltransferase
MTDERFDYSRGDIVKALETVGVCRGDAIFVHSNIGFFGKLGGARGPDEYYSVFKQAIFEVLGSEGTLVTPTFSYSFCHAERFDRAETASAMGFFSEAVRTDKDSMRSNDPNFSVAAIGGNARYLTESSPEHSFGPDGFFGRFLEIKGKFCNFNFDSGSTFFHYVERTLGVPYRYNKGFKGTLVENGRDVERTFYHYVFDPDKKNHYPCFTKFDRLAKRLGVAKTANLGKGQIVLVSARDTFDLIAGQLKSEPNFLIEGDV